VPVQVQERLQDVQHLGHLGEDEHAVAASLEVAQERGQPLQLAGVELHELLVGEERGEALLRVLEARLPLAVAGLGHGRARGRGRAQVVLVHEVRVELQAPAARLGHREHELVDRVLHVHAALALALDELRGRERAQQKS
jgi:hypothetical protein